MKTTLYKQNILYKHLLAVALAGMASLAASQGEITINMVTIGNPGNAAQSASNRDHGYSGGDDYGAVGYVYQIGTTEVNLAQYTEFLNTVDPNGSNALALYNTLMATDSNIAGIAFDSGAASGSKYSVIVTGVSGSTFTYNTSSSGTASGTGGTHLGASATHTAEADFWIPSEDEWYKAAYYNPTKNGGAGGYWLYATQSDTLAGNTIGVADSANYHDGNYAKDQNGLSTYLTDGGAYGEDSESYYGTSDQAGNVWEWDEAFVTSSSRGLRGGSWAIDGYSPSSSDRSYYAPAPEHANVGFRIASIPEPSTVVLMMLGGATLLAGRRFSTRRKNADT